MLMQQLSAVKSSMGAVNNTLADVEYNENLLKEGISRVTKYMDTLRLETNEKINLFSMKIEVEGHMLIDSVMNAQKGVLHPQIIPPINLMEALIKSVSAFPKDTTLPFPLSKDSAHFILRLCDLQVYIKNGILGYVILLPLVNRGNFNIIIIIIIIIIIMFRKD